MTCPTHLTLFSCSRLFSYSVSQYDLSNSSNVVSLLQVVQYPSRSVPQYDLSNSSHVVFLLQVDQYPSCSVPQYDLSNSSNVVFLLQVVQYPKSLRIRIKQLNEVFKETHTLHKAEELLKRHNHVAIIGAPGEGKTSTALKICEKYLHKKYEVVFVDNFEIFDVDTIIQRTCNMLVVFDDIFGSVTVPSNCEKIHKVSTALVDALFQQEHDAMKQKPNKQEETQAGEIQNKAHKLHFIFSSRSYNWNEGRGRMHQFKVNLFKPESVIDMTKTGLTTEEKKSIMNSFEKRSKKRDISNQDKNTIIQLQDSMFGFPLICQLYCTNPAFQMHNIIDFFQKPVTYLRGDLDTIVREGSSRSATLVLLVLCGGKLDLVSFKAREKNLTNLFQAVKEEIASCTQTDIGREIINFTGTYCTVENHVASFSHPSIYDAAACALGNLNEVFVLEHCSLQFLLEKGADLSLTDTGNNDCLMLASERGNVSIVKHLLSLKVLDINRRDSLKEQTAVMMAAERGHYGVYNLLVLEGADLSLTDTGNKDCLMLACEGVKHLLSLKTFDINRRGGSRKQTAVMMAAEGGCSDFYNLLVLEGADLSLTDRDNNDCLMLACLRNKVSIAKHLLSLKILDINRRDSLKEQTAVMIAAEGGHYDIYNLLVLEGADLSLIDKANKDCLMLACIGGNMSIVKHLLSLKTFDINRRDRSRKQTAVMMAAEGGHCDVFNLLVMEGADLSLTDTGNKDCLMLASERGDVSIVKHLLSLKILDINRRRGSRKQTAVMMAAEGRHYDIYNLLVLEGADLSLTDDDKMDCLMLASERGDVFIVKHLLFLKTLDINRCGGSRKQTAVMMAAERGHCAVYNLLVMEGADLSLADGNNMDCLMLASEKGYVSIVKHLLSLKTFDINRREGSKKQTAVMLAVERGHCNKDCLMLASERGYVSIVKHLLSLKTLDINRRDRSWKQTAVMMAAKRGDYDVYNLLVLEGADLSLTDKGKKDCLMLASEGENKDCLMLASEGGNVSIVKHLLSLKTFDINRRGGSWKVTALMMAAENGHYDVYYLLVLEGIDLSLGNEDNVDNLREARCRK
ncbi:serine/threonine-protein phosphatase 6 regulatory ankyrin repeat subunit B-like [Haliotis rufescens]|uniref:serine/threonine-protein phosphatase 6 regulatory ankyrin repeat subunit B-like n=1 Tax=Haliotis rufescens TaxID=6454 RepID=UPI00201F20FE|nr:serine/threonine-protein phosphatase 6 regulatory ankyrin repeat subunit B-like [Haliotis rufescens]